MYAPNWEETTPDSLKTYLCDTLNRLTWPRSEFTVGKSYRITHEPYLTEYLVRNYPLRTWRVNVRVGPVNPELVKDIVEPRYRRAAMVTVGSVDAIVELPDKTILVEAMIRDEPGKIQMLKMYRNYYLTDPAYAERRTLPIELMLLSPIYNPMIKHLCTTEGIRYVFYRPVWIETYLTTLPPRISSPRLAGAYIPT